jgi:hypothetical protein
MVAGAIGAIAEAIINGPEGQEYASMSVAGVDPAKPDKLFLLERTFQFWPESISDTIDIGWNFKDVAGASSALAQWGSNGGRTFSFELQFHRFMKPFEDRSGLEQALDPFHLNKPDNESPKDNRPNNVDIAAELRYLRAYCYPKYGVSDEILVASPPPIMIWSAPGMELNEDGGSTIYCIMTSCDVTYLLSFPNGVPRRASVAITLRQIVQRSTGVVWAGHAGEKAGKFVTPYLEKGQEKYIATGGGRTGNGIKGGQW